MAQAKKSTAKKTTEKAATKSPAKTAAKTAAKSDKGGETAGKQRGGLAQPVQPNDTLAAVVGKDPLTRAEMTKRIWDHIKKNGLQDASNKRMINADDKLRPIFDGKDQVNMFEMTKLVSKHLN